MHRPCADEFFSCLQEVETHFADEVALQRFKLRCGGMGCVCVEGKGGFASAPVALRTAFIVGTHSLP